MTGTAMTRNPARTLVLALFALVAAVLLPATSAHAARTSVPTVTNVAPLNLAIGDTLTITGRNFRAGRNRNTVVFKRDGQRAVFVTAAEATRTRIRLVVPTKLSQYLSRRTGGTARPTRFRLRVLSARFGRAFTATKLSPVIAEATPGSHSPSTGVTVRNPGGQQVTVPVDTDPDCDNDGMRNSVDVDDDNDLLTDALEVSLKLNTCNADTDGDGMTDGWEYQSAVDLNTPGCNAPSYPTPCAPARPYPWKVAYPNPLDGSDGNIDFDGDWIPNYQEHAAWANHPGHDLSIAGMWYSGGLKASQDPVADTCTGMPIPAPRAPFTQQYSDRLDLDPVGRIGHGCLSDNERDEDSDMLGNVEELTGEMSSIDWWTAAFEPENPFTHVTFAGTKWLDGDTDGDGVYDGLDDNDFDGFWNAEEIVRGTESVDENDNSTGVTTGLWVNPFNPCLPNRDSERCPEYVPLGADAWSPFDNPHPRWPEWDVWDPTRQAPASHPNAPITLPY
jgi:hypothetical protein